MSSMTLLGKSTLRLPESTLITIRSGQDLVATALDCRPKLGPIPATREVAFILRQA